MWLLNALIILTPFAWGVGWWFALKWIIADGKNRRNRASVGALGIVTLAGALWLPVGIYVAHNAGSSKFRTMDEWTAVALVICGFALIVSFFGRTRLILPIALACLGTASFWIGTTIQ